MTVEEVSPEEVSAKEGEPEAAAEQDRAPGQGGGGHTCSECGASFPRRYSLIMHTLKHEKARGYKCSVSLRFACSLELRASSSPAFSPPAVQ